MNISFHPWNVSPQQQSVSQEWQDLLRSPPAGLTTTEELVLLK